MLSREFLVWVVPAGVRLLGAEVDAVRAKAILFDLDGTLLDSVAVILKSFREVFEAMGLPFDEGFVRRHVGVPLRVQGKFFGGERAQEFVERYKVIYKGYHHLDHQLFPGTIEMLDAVRESGCRTAVVTSKSTPSAHRTTQGAGIADKFDAIVTADDVTHPKPHPEPLLRGVEMLGVTPREAIYVGDALSDVASARDAGLQMAAVSWGARSKEDLERECPGRVFDNWQEFLSWLDANPSSLLSNL